MSKPTKGYLLQDKSLQKTAESKTVRNLSDVFMIWGIFGNFII